MREIRQDGPPLALLLGIGVLCVGLTLAAMRVHFLDDNLFFAILGVQALLSVAAWRVATILSPARTLIVLVVGAVAIRLTLLSEPPLLSTDVYRYIWDGRILNAGFNPFRHVPAEPALAFLRDGDVYPYIDKKDYAVTLYPPAAQAIFAAVTRLADGLQPMRLAMLAFEAVAIAAMGTLCTRLAIHPARLALYLWHPFAAWEVANNAHVDAAMMAIIIAALAWSGSERPYGTAALVAVAALVKPFGALFLPSIWRPFDWRLPLFVVAVVAMLYLPLVMAGGEIFGFLGTYFREQGLDSGAGFYPVMLALKAGAPAWISRLYIVAGTILLLTIAILLALRRDRTLEDRIGEAAMLCMTFMLLLTPVYPWYFLLIAPFVVLCGSWCAFAMMTTGFWLYSFGPEQIEFVYRWSAMLALVTIAGAWDFWAWWRSRALSVIPGPSKRGDRRALPR